MPSIRFGQYGTTEPDMDLQEQFEGISERIEEAEGKEVLTREERDRLTKLYFERMLKGALLTQCGNFSF